MKARRLIRFTQAEMNSPENIRAELISLFV